MEAVDKKIVCSNPTASTVCQESTSVARGMPRVSLSLPGKARERRTYILLVGGETIGLLSHASTVGQGSTSVARECPGDHWRYRGRPEVQVRSLSHETDRKRESY